MAAKDYTICAGVFNLYLAKVKKPNQKGPQKMSQDRRPITESEMIGCFEFYLRRYCEKNNTDTVQISDENGKVLFEAKLLDKEDGV